MVRIDCISSCAELPPAISCSCGYGSPDSNSLVALFTVEQAPLKVIAQHFIVITLPLISLHMFRDEAYYFNTRADPVCRNTVWFLAPVTCKILGFSCKYCNRALQDMPVRT
jgi:hypothetical protein